MPFRLISGTGEEYDMDHLKPKDREKLARDFKKNYQEKVLEEQKKRCFDYQITGFDERQMKNFEHAIRLVDLAGKHTKDNDRHRIVTHGLSIRAATYVNHSGFHYHVQIRDRNKIVFEAHHQAGGACANKIYKDVKRGSWEKRLLAGWEGYWRRRTNDTKNDGVREELGTVGYILFPPTNQ